MHAVKKTFLREKRSFTVPFFTRQRFLKMKFHNRKSDRSHPRIPLRTSSRSSAVRRCRMRNSDFPEPSYILLQNCHPTVNGITTQNDIAAAFAVFFVRIYHVTGPGKDSGKKCMVKVFPIVVITDRSSKKSRQFLRNTIAVTTQMASNSVFRFQVFALSSNQRTTVVSKISL